ncbi:MAG TPA: hypothetical protein DCY00_04105, partial [Actinobacteria bacterium]|nr:hypothetical protein [Actinomycetota bacterium]
MRISGLIGQKNLLSNEKAKRFTKIFNDFGLAFAIVLMIIYFSVTTRSFLSSYNIGNITKQITTLGLVSYGMAFVIIGGGIDLSVGSCVGMVSVIMALVMKQTDSIIMGLVISLLCALLLGALNGLCVTKFKVQPFVQTLAMGYIAYGIGMLLTNGESVEGLSAKFLLIGSVYILKIPVQAWYLLITGVACYTVLNKTVFGASLYSSASSTSGTGS